MPSPGALRAAALRRRPHLTIGCIAAALAVVPAGAVATFGLVTLLAATTAWLLTPRRAVLGITLMVVAALGGSLRLEAIDRPARAAPAGTALEADATLLERPRAGLFGSSAPMRIDSGPAAGLKIMARNHDSFWRAASGDRFHIRGLVTSGDHPARTNRTGIPALEANAGRPGTPGFGPLPALRSAADQFDYAALLRSRGIGRELRLEALRPLGHRRGLPALVDSIRARAERGISAGLPAERAALARGMVLGEDGDLPDGLRDDFRRAGLAHLVAASGQNVALMCALVLPLLMLAGASSRVRVAVLLPLVALYVALAGSGASVVRAGIMAGAALVALAAGRRSSAIYTLLLAAALTLAANPRASADPGWRLSFAAVLGMLLLGPGIQRHLRHLPRPLAEALGATLAATLATAPLMAHEFGRVSVAALPANLAAIPAVAPVMWIGMAEAAMAQVAAFAPLGTAFHGLGAVLAPAAALALGWISHVASYFAARDWAQLDAAPSWPAVLAIYGAGGGAILASRQLRRSDVLGAALDWRRSLTPASRRALAAPVAALALAAVARASAPAHPPRLLTVDFIDVGQGDSTLIRDPYGASVLFDGGVPEARVDRTLTRLGVRSLSLVVATHQSRDHHAGLLQVVRRFPVGLFLDGRYGVDDPSFVELEREVDRRHIPRRWTQAGQRLRIGAMTIRILWPPPRGNRPPPADPNTRATVAIVSERGFDLFLSADAEAPVLLPLRLPHVDAMKVPHHGSAETGLTELLRRLSPRVAAIETGRGNPYGHPRPSTLHALRRIPLVYRTDRDGTVELTVQGDRIAIRTHR